MNYNTSLHFRRFSADFLEFFDFLTRILTTIRTGTNIKKAETPDKNAVSYQKS